MTSPVVTLTCPNCGGSVQGAEPGERVRCIYCGTVLHLPRVEPAERERDAHEPTFAPVPSDRPAPARALIFVLLSTALVGTGVVVLATRSSPPPPAPAPTPIAPIKAPGEDVDALMEQAHCFLSCNEPCHQIKDPTAMVACIDECNKRCKFAGKGAGPECRARCGKRCAGAPDAPSRASCEVGCSADCPP